MQATLIPQKSTIQVLYTGDNWLPTIEQLELFQKEHYTKMLNSEKFGCRSLARKTLFNLKK